MWLYDKFELLENERKLRLTYSLNSNTTSILIVDIDNLFKEIENEKKSNYLLNKIIYGKKKILN